MTTTKELIQERAKLHDDSKKLLDTAAAEKRTLTPEENATFDKMDDRIMAISDHLDRENRQAERAKQLAQGLGRKTSEDAGLANDLNEQHGDGPLSLKLGRNSNMTIAADGAIRVNGRLMRGASLKDIAARSGQNYRDQFENYILGGPGPRDGLMTGAEAKGGYLAPTQMAAQLIKFIDDNTFMRSLCTVLPPLTQAVSLGAPSWDTDPGDADWTAEVPASAISEDDTARVGKRELTPHLLTKLVKVSMKMLRAGAIDVESYLAERLAYKFAITEEKAFLTGTGSNRPLGIFTASDQGVPTSRDTTCSSATEPTADDIIEALYALKEGHMNNATLLASRTLIKKLRKLKDGEGQYLWQPGLQGGQPNLVLGRPYVMSEYVPATFTTGQYIGMWANFKAGYWIVDSLQLEIQRLSELYAATNQVGIIARKETDGMPVLAEAFSRIKLA